MTTEFPSSSSSAPSYTFINRIYSIPLVSDSLSTIHNTLSTNAYTQRPYTTAQGLTTTAYQYAQPLQVKLAPILVKADGYANKAVDVVESRYPYPFHTPTEEIVKGLREKSDQARDVANKTIDERVRSPVYGVAQGIDQRFAPLIDVFETYVNKIHAQAPETPSEASEATQYQYQRAIALTMNLRDSIFVYTNEQLSTLQKQSVLVQKATETAHTLSTVASTSYHSTQEKVHSLSDTMLQELHKIQATTSSLPQHLQTSLQDITASLHGTISDLSAVLHQKDVPLSTKAAQIATTAQEKIKPILEAATVRVNVMIGVVKGKKEEKERDATYAEVVKDGAANGHSE